VATTIALDTTLAPFVRLDVGGVEEHVAKGHVAQRPVAEGGHHLVELAADAADRRVGDARLDPECSNEIIDLAGGDPVDVRLHHDRPQRLVDAPTRLE
jgi:hypothetical protein